MRGVHVLENQKDMMNLLTKLFLVLSVSVSSLAYAEGSVGAGTINLVYFYQEHTGVLITHSNQINPDGCASNAHFILRDTHPHYKNVYAMLLAANLSGKKVSIGLSGCHEGFPNIKHVAVYKD